MNKDNMSRETRIVDQMDLLGIKDVSTPRQCKNGTVVWKLPIKIGSGNKDIEVASFKTGYVRNQNCGYSNYQLNKRCEGKPEYFKLNNGDYRMFTTRGCVLIPREIDRLEYLIKYCVRNYYIKHANFVANGEYVHKSQHKWELEQAKDKYKKLDDFYESSKVFNDSMYEGRNDRVKDLEDKLQSIIRTARH